MRSSPISLTYEIEFGPGEKFTLPEALVESVSAGRWIITIQPAATEAMFTPIRNHSAFLNSYAPEDEGLYDDYPTG